jgi:hypothetical protein
VNRLSAWVDSVSQSETAGYMLMVVVTLSLGTTLVCRTQSFRHCPCQHHHHHHHHHWFRRQLHHLCLADIRATQWVSLCPMATINKNAPRQTLQPATYAATMCPTRSSSHAIMVFCAYPVPRKSRCRTSTDARSVAKSWKRSHGCSSKGEPCALP